MHLLIILCAVVFLTSPPVSAKQFALVSPKSIGFSFRLEKTSDGNSRQVYVDQRTHETLTLTFDPFGKLLETKTLSAAGVLKKHDRYLVDRLWQWKRVGAAPSFAFEINEWLLPNRTYGTRIVTRSNGVNLVTYQMKYSIRDQQESCEKGDGHLLMPSEIFSQAGKPYPYKFSSLVFEKNDLISRLNSLTGAISRGR